VSTTTQTPRAGPAPTTRPGAARNTPNEPPPRTKAIASPAIAADDDEAPSPTARGAATRATLVALCVVLAAHAWIVSAGWLSLPWPQYSNYYARLAEAFDHRQASLLQQPDPGLLALPDPFEPVASRPYRQQNGIHDCVLFDGKLYLYWGPVPALLLVPFQRIGHGRLIGDQYLVFAFAVGAIGFTGLLLRRLWERFFPEQPAWTLIVGVIICGLASPIAYLLARSAVYEAAIMGGQFFLTAGLYLLVAPPWVLPQPNWKRPAVAKLPGSDDPLVAAFMGGRLIRPRRLPAKKPPFGSTGGEACAAAPAAPANLDPLPSPFRLALVGGCWALAVGSRVSLALAVIALSAMVCLWIFRRSRRAKTGIGLPRLAAFGLPLVAGAIALASYNYARFGNWLEFGQRYQLAASNYHAFPALFSLKNVPANLYSYALRPVYVLKGFPFLEARIGDGTFPPFIPLPPHYEYSEPIAGLLLTAPFVWLAAVPVLGLVRAGWFFLFVRRAGFGPYCRSGGRIRAEARTTSGEGNRSQVETVPSIEGDPDLTRILASLVCAIVLSFLPVLLMVGSTMRYLADVWPCLAVMSVVGVWQRRRALARCGTPPRRRKTFNTIVLSLASGTVVVGMLLSITGYYDHFLHHNPDLFAPLSYRTRPAILGHEQ
jgi:hypothetical protein